jgi:hypothetical protein
VTIHRLRNFILQVFWISYFQNDWWFFWSSSLDSYFFQIKSCQGKFQKCQCTTYQIIHRLCSRYTNWDPIKDLYFCYFFSKFYAALILGRISFDLDLHQWTFIEEYLFWSQFLKWFQLPLKSQMISNNKL